jgi:glycosyltransferase involved in cell wall biosynthesis
MKTLKKVLFDSRWAGDHGIGRYAREIYPALNNIQHEKITAGDPLNVIDLAFQSLRSRLSKDTIFLSPAYNAPLLFPSRSIITIHDLMHIHFPEYSTPIRRLYYQTLVKSACQQSPCVFTGSEFSKQQIIQWTGIDEGKVIITGYGVDERYHQCTKQWAPGHPYFLYIGNTRPHKNLARLIKAFLTADINEEIILYLSGNPSPELNDLLLQQSSSKRIQFLGRIKEEKLPEIYQGATALLLPSLYEGFGLPIIEAMASRTAVLTSDITAMPETAGDAALLVNPTSISAIRRGIEVLASNSTLRKELICKGTLSAQHFTWDKVREKIYNTITGVLNTL